MSDFTPSFKIKLDNLHNLIETTQDELNKLRLVYTNFPDIEVTSYHRQDVYFTSKVNNIADDFDTTVKMGHLYIMPFLIFNGIQIYSNPIELKLATTSEDYDGYDFFNNYIDILINNNISYVVIEKIKFFQERNLPDPYDDFITSSLKENE